MSDNTKHLAKKCVKDAGPCLALCAAGAAVALLAVLGQWRRAPKRRLSARRHCPCRRHDDRRCARSDFLGI